MSTDTLDLPPITGIEPSAAAQVPAVTTGSGEVSALAKAALQRHLARVLAGMSVAA